MKKLLLIAVFACLAVVVNAQVVDYRDVFTGQYTCTWVDTTTALQQASQGTDYLGVSLNLQNDSNIFFAGPQNRLIECKVNGNGEFYGAGNGGYYELYGTFGQQSFTAIEYTFIATTDVGSTRWYTCAKTGQVTVAENAINTNVFVTQTDGGVLINQQGKLYANSVKLYTVDGKEIAITQLTNTTQTLKTTGLGAGMYLLAFYTNSQFVGSKKVVVN